MTPGISSMVVPVWEVIDGGRIRMDGCIGLEEV
jgi:hypothetical protein